MKTLTAAVNLKLWSLRRGQSMTEYALILAAVAVVVFATYHVMGQDLVQMVGQVNHQLTQ